ncbi:MAG: sulfite exporter TauE/SafE family protein [Stagnimonas sp.]|nr:sulfite exporter TauE/SafE family protein [Stagnimonas sp.]
MAELPALSVIGLVLGLVLGLTGAGGSILAVPLLMAGLGWDFPRAAALALTAVAASAAVGAWSGWRQGLVRYRAAALMAVTGLPLAPLGMLLAQRLPHRLLELLFAAIMLVAGVRLYRQTLEAEVARGAVPVPAGESAEVVCKLDPATGRLSWNSPCAAALAATGALTGLLSGLLGVGGGFVLVPVLRQLTELSMHSAVATALLFVALVSGGAVLLAAAQGSLPVAALALPFAAAAVVGMLLGRRLAPKLAGPRLQRGFAGLMGLVAASMVLAAYT